MAVIRSQRDLQKLVTNPLLGSFFAIYLCKLHMLIFLLLIINENKIHIKHHRNFNNKITM